ncbi:MAG TPA: enolase C-terminal domain-like protein, partial [Flavisolibacter sp.]|nr:enolase C-terminal domain-like protein [Flavisolibacter sp.]
LAKDEWEGMKMLYQESPLPLMADESCVSEHDVDKCLHHFHGINIKLTKCSGITPALRMINRARELDLKVMVGSMNESTLGSAAIAHLMPLIDYVDVDGPLLLEEDIATGLDYTEDGHVYTSSANGLGVEMTSIYTK